MIQKIRGYFADSDIKERLHIAKAWVPELQLIGQGEYNANYAFIHPETGQKLVFRVNTGSQMHLDDQIGYEASALEILKSSARTPGVFYVDGSRRYIEEGILVMEFLEGRPLRYETDMELAAACLADIHSTKLPADHHLLCPDNPWRAVYEECVAMAGVYLGWAGAGREAAGIIERLLIKAEGLIKADTVQGNYIINTELNSGNFLINGPDRPNYLIDWEKPIIGHAEQDLGHFLAPTTTFWKTDFILERAEMERFIELYKTSAAGRIDLTGLEERFDIYLRLTCLRGITWCAMAYVEYQSPDRELYNRDTYEKIRQYLDVAFLNQIESEYY